MPELAFFVEGARPQPRSAVPTLLLALRAVNATPEPVHAIVLRCQVQIDPGRGRYSLEQQQRVSELFGPVDRWDESLRPVLWQQVSVTVGSFVGTTVAELPLPCPLDLSLAATRYLEAMQGEGDIPLRMVFSGTAFYARGEAVRATPIGWDLETQYRLPARLWQELMESYYPRSRWMQMSHDLLQRLEAYRAARGLATTDQALQALLDAAPAPRPAPRKEAA